MPIPSKWLTYNLHKIAKDLPQKAPTIPVGHPLIGQIGYIHPGREFKLQGMSSRTFDALMRDEDRIFMNPQKYRRKYLRECGAITTWDGVLANRAAGYFDDRMYYKASITTVANTWSASFGVGGYPVAGTYANYPAGSTLHSNNTGAFWFPDAGENRQRYLLNFGVQHMSGTNIVLLVDLLFNAGGINTNAAGNYTINPVTLPRYAGIDGVYFTFVNTTGNLGNTASNITVTYVNSNNQSRNTEAFPLTTGARIHRLQPSANNSFMTPLADGDIGVNYVTNVNISANMGAVANLALLQFKPLVLIPTLATTTYVERSTPGMLCGIIPLPKSSGGNNCGCLSVFILTSGNATGVQTYFFQTVEG